MKRVSVYVREKSGATFTTTYGLNNDFPKEVILKNIETIKGWAKKDNPNAELIDVLITTTPKISKNKLMEVGMDVASGWGAECLSVNTYDNLVEFKCIECGDRFSTFMTYDEIKRDYKNLIK